MAEEVYEGETFEVARTIQSIRKALVVADYNNVDEGIKALRTMGEYDWLSLMCDEVATYLSHRPYGITAKTLLYIIGYHIKKRRNELGMTAAQLAASIGTGIAQQTISGYECGRKGFSWLVLYRIVKALNVDISYFFGQGIGTEPIQLPATSSIDPKNHRLMKLLETVPTDVQTAVVDTAYATVAFCNTNFATDSAVQSSS